jgi:hypothetical protein
MSDFYKEKDGQLSFVKPVKETDKRSLYKYTGPVFRFDQCIATVTLETWANTPAKAYSNMVYQVKQRLGYQPTAQLRISKNLIVKEELQYGKSV